MGVGLKFRRRASEVPPCKPASGDSRHPHPTPSLGAQQMWSWSVTREELEATRQRAAVGLWTLRGGAGPEPCSLSFPSLCSFH